MNKFYLIAIATMVSTFAHAESEVISQRPYRDLFSNTDISLTEFARQLTLDTGENYTAVRISTKTKKIVEVAHSAKVGDNVKSQASSQDHLLDLSVDIGGGTDGMKLAGRVGAQLELNSESYEGPETWIIGYQRTSTLSGDKKGHEVRLGLGGVDDAGITLTFFAACNFSKTTNKDSTSKKQTQCGPGLRVSLFKRGKVQGYAEGQYRYNNLRIVPNALSVTAGVSVGTR